MTCCPATSRLDALATTRSCRRGWLGLALFAAASLPASCQEASSVRFPRIAELRLLLPPATRLAAEFGTAAASASHHGFSEPRGSSSQVRAPGYLGISFHDLTEEQATGLHIRGAHGVEVIMIDHDGPAGVAGLRPADVILSLNGQLVTSSEALRRMIREEGAGAGIVLTVLRGGSSVTVNAQLADRSDVERAALARIPPDPAPPVGNGPMISSFAEDSAAASAAPASAHGQSFLSTVLHIAPYTGLELSGMEPQLAMFFGAPRDQGLVVETVVSGSPAAAAGLRAGDVLLRADGQTVHSASEWTRHLHASKQNPITLQVLRDKRELTLTLKPQLKHHSLLELPLPSLAVKG